MGWGQADVDLTPGVGPFQLCQEGAGQSLHLPESVSSSKVGGAWRS